MGEHTADRPRIVVGIDGSAPSKAALRWAMRQAELSGAVVEPVLARREPLESWYGLAENQSYYDEAAGNYLAEVVDEVLGADRAGEVRPKVVQGHAAAVLVEAAQGADLLVIGHRGLGGLAGSLLGSVSRYCVQHATCPVVVVRKPRD
ncbi:universal stress protein [Streptantibioticus cattleyicolor]|uniref:UspA domain protein n=1 Tax=Streptantibioticus cattleyicolor (strain ATCC 35852 / DSM 46488 / JCM 4925 / NBRC 14057 / NRRL 8057) TaxID=1003195 RepID=F8JLP0_STREN|nr:universal stress protein [Streptantibioticus cattleyicolor]AEW99532.1 UspA domain protein [Streptantibioticus cattleyicolor NRRL 8057 = DSM 46488]CCB71430.1 Universal stress protein UspA-like protein [Streptantibioticus cattleyicolor NRRL 8057 = DSM 46488]